MQYTFLAYMPMHICAMYDENLYAACCSLYTAYMSHIFHTLLPTQHIGVYYGMESAHDLHGLIISVCETIAFLSHAATMHCSGSKQPTKVSHSPLPSSTPPVPTKL